jgi:outer membrane protein assembly factor BamB
VHGRWTTRCCSAVALIALSCGTALAQTQAPLPFPSPTSSVKQNPSKLDKTPPAIVPARAVWTLVLNSQLSAPPAYDDTHVYFALEGNRIAAYTLPEGTRAWIVSAHPQLPPAAGDGLLFLVENGALVARRSVDGAVAWHLPLDDPLVVAPAYENGWLIVSTKSGVVAALRADTGRLIWQHGIGSPAHARPTIADDRVYVPSTDGRLVALRVDTGEPIWERRLGGAAFEVLSLGERIYAGSIDNYFYCVLARDGAIDWRWRTGGDIVGQPVADERHVFYVSLDNVLRAMDRKTGAQVWVRALPVRPIGPAVLAGSTLLVAGQPAQLRAFATKDGTPAPGEPIVPGAPAATATPIRSAYTPGIDIPVRPLVEGELGGAMPKKIPPEVEVAAANAPTPPKPVTLSGDAENAAAPHVIFDPVTRLPMVMMITKDIARGAGVTLVKREFDPPIATISPLPNMVMIAPQTTPPRR